MPASAMRAPPIPKRRYPGASARSARHSAAPCRSPEASPAASMIDGASPGALDTDERHPDQVGVPQARLPVDDQHTSTLDGDHRREALRDDRKTIPAVP